MPPLTILVSGMLGAVPAQGGWSWVILHYCLGLQRLGHEVYFVEPIDRNNRRPADGSLAGTENARYFRDVLGRFGLFEHASLFDPDTHESVGLSYGTIADIADRADVLLNLSGRLQDPRLVNPVEVRVYLDLDPAFTQLWQAQEINMHLDGHTHFATVGPAIGTPECPVPTLGRSWVGMFQPAVLEQWTHDMPLVHDGLTTVANWRGYGSVEHEGVVYGQKAHSLRQFMTLPTRTQERFLLALAIHEDEREDLAALRSNGWTLLDPLAASGTPDAYRSFIQGSKAEFGIAKSGYVDSRCGWFSDRSVCYLASGRPVIAQDTGFSRFFPTGRGLFAFETEDDVLAAIEELNRDYPGHCRAARARSLRSTSTRIRC